VRAILFVSEVPKPTQPVGSWMRDLGFKLIELGVEANMMQLVGQDAKSFLLKKGVEFMVTYDVLEPVPDRDGVVREMPSRAGARRFPDTSPEMP